VKGLPFHPEGGSSGDGPAVIVATSERFSCLYPTEIVGIIFYYYHSFQRPSRKNPDGDLPGGSGRVLRMRAGAGNTFSRINGSGEPIS
jgi:hypothetical protein